MRETKDILRSSTVDKKKSVNKIIMDMGNNQQPFLELFEKEFHELTILGNDFSTRHHKTTKRILG